MDQALFDSGVCVAVIVEMCTSAMGRNSKNRWGMLLDLSVHGLQRKVER